MSGYLTPAAVIGKLPREQRNDVVENVRKWQAGRYLLIEHSSTRTADVDVRSAVGFLRELGEAPSVLLDHRTDVAIVEPVVEGPPLVLSLSRIVRLSLCQVVSVPDSQDAELERDEAGVHFRRGSVLAGPPIPERVRA